jgi:hypothetical protein
MHAAFDKDSLALTHHKEENRKAIEIQSKNKPEWDGCFVVDLFLHRQQFSALTARLHYLT